MYFGNPISPRPCPPSTRSEFNSSRSKLRVYNPNSSFLNNSSGSLLNDSSDESPNSSFHFTVENMPMVTISPRSPRFSTTAAQNNIFNKAYYKRQRPNKIQEVSNPYSPIQPLTDEKIDQIKAILKMSYVENKENPDEKSQIIDDQNVSDLLARIETRLQTLEPSYFSNYSIPSTPSSSTNSLHRIPINPPEVSSPLSPRRLSNGFNNSRDFSSSFQSSSDCDQKKKLRICRTPSADIEKYLKIDKNGNDQIDRKIIDLKEKLNKIADLVKSRNSNS